DRERSPGQLFRDFRRQSPEIDLPGGQCVIPGDGSGLVEKNFGHRQVLVLVLKCLRLEPVVHLFLTRGERLPRVSPGEPFEPEPLRKPDAVHDPPRIRAPSLFWAGVSFAGALRAVQNASCSSGVRAMTCSPAAS